MEVKSVTLGEEARARFPNAVTAREARPVRGLTELERSASPLKEAVKAGVRILGRRCCVDVERVVLRERVPARAG